MKKLSLKINYCHENYRTTLVLHILRLCLKLCVTLFGDWETLNNRLYCKYFALLQQLVYLLYTTRLFRINVNNSSQSAHYHFFILVNNLIFLPYSPDKSSKGLAIRSSTVLSNLTNEGSFSIITLLVFTGTTKLF